MDGDGRRGSAADAPHHFWYNVSSLDRTSGSGCDLATSGSQAAVQQARRARSQRRPSGRHQAWQGGCRRRLGRGIPAAAERRTKPADVHPPGPRLRSTGHRSRSRQGPRRRALSFLLDTNVISEIRRGRDRNVRAWAEAVDDIDLHLSVLTIGEIRMGIDRLRGRDADQAKVFARWLGELRSRFADRILPVGAEVADEWGRLNAVAPRSTVDSLLAATALVHGLTVVTRNTEDFKGCEVRLLDPWKHEPPKI